jgi:HAD superfamily hydrolase (TIGR01549 family)
LNDAKPPDTPANSRARIAPRQLEQPQSVRAIFFDVGFTLLAPFPSVVEIAGRVCDAHGLAIERECLERQVPAAEASLRHAVRAAPQTWADDRAISDIWQEYFTVLLRPCFPARRLAEFTDVVAEVRRGFEHHGSYALYPDVALVLRALHARGITMGVISDWGTSLSAILRAHDLNRFFDFAVISATLRQAKPHPWLFETALRRANAIPDYALHVGDSYVLDVLGARSMGIPAVLIDRAGLFDPADIDVPVVRDLFELLDLLEIEREGIDDLGGG